MRQLEGYKESERHVGQVAARAAIAKAYRCYYVAESYAAAEKWREALVGAGLNSRSASRSSSLNASLGAPQALAAPRGSQQCRTVQSPYPRHALFAEASILHR